MSYNMLQNCHPPDSLMNCRFRKTPLTCSSASKSSFHILTKVRTVIIKLPVKLPVWCKASLQKLAGAPQQQLLYLRMSSYIQELRP